MLDGNGMTIIAQVSRESVRISTAMAVVDAVRGYAEALEIS